MIVNGTQLAEMYGVDRRTVTNWLQEEPPCPSKVGKRGVTRTYDTADVAKWHAERAARKALANRPVVASDLALDEARKAKADADIAEMKRDQLRGKLTDNEVTLQVVDRAFHQVRSRVVSVRGRWAPRIVGLTSVAEATKVLDEMATDILAALNEGADEMDAEEDVA